MEFCGGLECTADVDAVRCRCRALQMPCAADAVRCRLCRRARRRGPWHACPRGRGTLTHLRHHRSRCTADAVRCICHALHMPCAVDAVCCKYTEDQSVCRFAETVP